MLYRSLGPVDLEDHVHDIFVRLFRFIARGNVRYPDYMKTLIGIVTRREIGKIIRLRVRQGHSIEYEEGLDEAPWSYRNSTDAERQMIQSERAKLVQRTLDLLKPQQKEILLRFYVEHEPWREIARDMGLTDKNFRLRKSRAKASFGVIGKKLMRPPLKKLVANA